MLTDAGRDGEHTPLVRGRAAEKDAEADESSPEVLAALKLCVFTNLAVQSVTNTQILMASQIQYVSGGPWFFMLVQSASIIAGTILTILATRYDEQFDRVFGILTTMHFRIVIVGLLTSVLAICLAIFQNGYAQVILGFFCAFCAVAAQLAVFQLVAVLNPKWQAASTGAVVLSVLVPMLTIECVGADVSAHWTMDQRLLVFAPPVVLTLFSVALFALFWPTDLHIEDLPGRASTPRQKGEDPAITADSASSFISRSPSSTNRGLMRGLNRMLSKETPPESSTNPAQQAPGTLVWPPFPYTLVSAISFLDGVLGFIYPLVALTPDSGGQAELIIAKFRGEIAGHTLGVILIFIGVAAANYGSLAFFVVVGLGRVIALIWIVPLILLGRLQPLHMFWFRATENVLFCTGTPIALLASKLSDRRAVLRSDTFVHFSSGCIGVVAALLVVVALDRD